MPMPTFATVDDYIAAQAATTQPRLHELRASIRAAAPAATEGISYGIPTYKFSGGFVSFGAAKRHCALYGVPLDAFPEDVRGLDMSKGTLRFPLDKAIPADLVRKLVLAKVNGTAASR